MPINVNNKDTSNPVAEVYSFRTPLKEVVSTIVNNWGYSSVASIIWYSYDRYMEMNQPSHILKDYVAPMLIVSSVVTLVGKVDKIAMIFIGPRPENNDTQNCSNYLKKAGWTVILFVEGTALKADEIGTKLVHVTARNIDRAAAYLAPNLFADNPLFGPLVFRSLNRIEAKDIPLNELSSLEIFRQAIINTVKSEITSLVPAYLGMYVINRVNPAFVEGLKEFSFEKIIPIICAGTAGYSFILLNLTYLRAFGILQTVIDQNKALHDKVKIENYTISQGRALVDFYNNVDIGKIIPEKDKVVYNSNATRSEMYVSFKTAIGNNKWRIAIQEPVNSLYDLVGLTPQSSDEEVEARFSKLSEALNPVDSTEEAKKLFKACEKAKAMILESREKFEIVDPQDKKEDAIPNTDDK